MYVTKLRYDLIPFTYRHQKTITYILQTFSNDFIQFCWQRFQIIFVLMKIDVFGSKYYRNYFWIVQLSITLHSLGSGLVPKRW